MQNFIVSRGYKLVLTRVFWEEVRDIRGGGGDDVTRRQKEEGEG